MELSTLKKFRIFVPGAIVFFCAFILVMVTKLFKIPEPDLNYLLESLAVLVIGIIYQFTPLRVWINTSYHDRVNEKIRSRMVEIAAIPDNREKFTWKKIRVIFYDIIDNDESLKVKSKLVMFNGLIWTSAADLTAISILYLGYTLILILSNVNNAPYAAILFFTLGFVGFVGSIKTTEKHIELGKDQLDLIEEKYSSEVRGRVLAIA